MKHFYRILLASAMSLAALCGAAQRTASGYFLDDYTYRHQLNPAFGNSRGYVAMPALGNVNAWANGTLPVSSVIYSVDGQTTTFLNPGVSVNQVMSNIKDRNRIGTDVSLTLLSAGFKAWGGYNTVTVNVRTDAGVTLPRSLFSLLKEGAANRTYDIKDVGAFAVGYAEVGFGHSHDVTDEVRLGGNFKFLVGMANADVKFSKASLELGRDNWVITADAQAQVNIKGFEYKTTVDKKTGREYVNGVKVSNTGINGFGAVVDLGVVYRPKALKDFEFSLSLLDLGFIAWSNNVVATTGGERTFTTDKYTFNVNKDAPNSFSKEWDKIKDDFSALYQLDNRGNTGGRTTMLGATLNVGVLYAFPPYRNLRFGLLNTTRIQGAYSWTDFRLSANIMPCKVFDAGINVSAGTYGIGFGWLLNLHCTGFNLFVGMDRTVGTMAKQFVPLNSNAQLNLGLNFLFN